jgi:hypothetical protein
MDCQHNLLSWYFSAWCKVKSMILAISKFQVYCKQITPGGKQCTVEDIDASFKYERLLRLTLNRRVLTLLELKGYYYILFL